MKKNPTYHFYVVPEQKKVICTTRFAGKSVRAVAKCSPMDSFDPVFGKELAKARVDVKVAGLRYDFAVNREALAQDAVNVAERKLDKATIYVDEAYVELEDAINELEDVTNKL